jgi:hypothetical protein
VRTNKIRILRLRIRLSGGVRERLSGDLLQPEIISSRVVCIPGTRWSLFGSKRWHKSQVIRQSLKPGNTKGGKYLCTIDLLLDWFGISCMTTDDFYFYLWNTLIQTSQRGGQRKSDISPLVFPD